jgi:hypothetical protein
MSKSIVITVPHSLGKDEARRRLALEIDHLKSAYGDKLTESDVNWSGDVAMVRVVALAQEVKAQIDVAAESVRLEIILPWLLAAIAGQVEALVTTTARDKLAIAHTPSSGQS